jgi:glycerol-3-phosphate acyltransferase PlsY
MWPVAFRVLVALAIGYLLGGIPWALIVGLRFYGIDPRQHGSGNLGATNVYRVLGPVAAVAVAVLDILKGSVAVLVALAIVPDSMGTTAQEWTAVAAMMSAVLGHSYSPYIGFKGGKGVATSAGGLFVLTPIAAVIELIVFVAVVAASRLVSLGSVVIACLYPPLVLWLYGDSIPYVITAFVLAALVLWRHRSNIVRIARGEERKISLHPEERAPRARGHKEGE